MYHLLAIPAALLALNGALSLDVTTLHVPNDCTGCLLSGDKGGPNAESFEFDFDANEKHLPGQKHGHGECEKSAATCFPNACTVNGTLVVTNDLGQTVYVHWRGESGGVEIADGEQGELSTGYETIHCDGDKRIEVRSGGDEGPVEAFYDWDCTDCVETTDPI